MANRTQKAKEFLKGLTPAVADGLEAMVETTLASSDLEGVFAAARVPSAEQQVVRSTVEKLKTGADLSGEEQFALEAIIIPDRRPAVDIRNGDFTVTHRDWTHYSSDAAIRQRIREALPSIGRIEVSGLPNLPYGGTGFVVGPDVIMTNRHVAQIFAQGLGVRGLAFRDGVGSGIDFKQERDSDERAYLDVRKVLMVHPFWDMALLQVDGLGDEHKPLVLSPENPDDLATRQVAVVGYPAFDPRNPADVQNKVFGGVYYVKRLQPGLIGGRRTVTSFAHEVSALAHDASTLGGNSGSAVLDVTTGRVVALHFGGAYLDANFTVPAAELARDQRVIAARVNFAEQGAGDPETTARWWKKVATAEAPPEPGARRPAPAPTPGARGPRGGSVSLTIPLTVTVSLGTSGALGAPGRLGAALGDATARVQARYRPSPLAGASDGAGMVEGEEAVVADYRDRRGYDPEFLGKRRLAVDLPSVERNADDILDFALDGTSETELRYEHYSVLMSRSRRMCFLSAVNIDGNLSRKSKRVGWKWDPRIPKAQQIMNECYGATPRFSRGHMTRREDPGWGAAATAKRGNEDSMHVTNATPQMQAFNAPIWLALEDYALEHAREDDMKISVFTGPYFSNRDPEMYGVRIPLAFWKVIAFIHDDTGKLCATGYEMNQEQSLLPEEEFVFGSFTSPQLGTATQVSIRAIEARSGISFGKLAGVDPLAGTEEALGDGPRPPLSSLEEILFVR